MVKLSDKDADFIIRNLRKMTEVLESAKVELVKGEKELMEKVTIPLLQKVAKSQIDKKADDLQEQFTQLCKCIELLYVGSEEFEDNK